jgi:chromate transport protein ChrA
VTLNFNKGKKLRRLENQTMKVAKVSPEVEIELQANVEVPGPSQPTEETIERGTSGSTSVNDNPVDEFQDNSQVPRHSPLRLFWFFLWRFGLFAWGGPVAQIALIKEQLVIKHKWITIARFNRAFAVYQILPGPEAAELCMFFGCLSGGRLGGIAAGIGFILPGFLLMLLASYLYILVGFDDQYVNASFRALQPLVAAMVNIFGLSHLQILRATHKIAEHTFVSNETKKINPVLFLAALLTAMNTALRINWYISMYLKTN